MMRWLAMLLSVCVVTGCGRGAPSASEEGGNTAPEASAAVHAEASGSVTEPRVSRLEALRPESMPEGFALVTEPRRFEFPRDHGPHPEYRHEWWYVTGHLDAANGEQFGFELTFFRFALKPLAASPAVVPQSAWRARQIYMAHFAVTDLDRGRFHAAERFSRDALALSGAEAEPFRVWLEDWSLGEASGQEPASGLAASSGKARSWRLHARDAGYEFDLELRSDSTPVLNGDAGFSRKSAEPGAASYYYSMPRMSTHGRIVRDGRTFDVNGFSWLDREWGSGSLGGDQQGWDWFALQLDDGSALMFYALRKRNGERDAHSAGTWVSPDGVTKALSSDDVQIEVKDFWTSPRGGRYPARWQLHVPSLALDVDVRPRMQDQELDLSTRYWEGAATIEGTRAARPVGGRAYVELVGYAAAPDDPVN